MFLFADNATDNKVDLSKEPKNVDLDALEDKAEPTIQKPAEDVLDDFFQGLDETFNGAIFDDQTVVPTVPAQPDLDDPVTDPEPKPVETDEVAKLRSELEELKTRYDNSSQEAQRLYEENKRFNEYANYMPILDEMRSDPALVNHVQSYLEGNNAPQSVAEQLKLPEDFLFDADEAVRNPNSDSAKVFGEMMDRAVSRRMSQQRRVDQQEYQRQQQIDSFRQESDISEEEFNQLMDYGKRTKLTLKDIHYLMNREKREKEIAKKAIEEQEKKLKAMRGTPRSMAASGGSSEDISEDEKIFSAIKAAQDGMNYFD
jgi:hypothetical protein